MKIWTCGSSPQNGPWSAWMQIKNVNSASRLSNFWNFLGAIQMISCRNWWPWTKPGYITITSAGEIEGHFEGKMPLEGHQGGLVLAQQCPVSPGTCNPEETGLPGLPLSWSPTLFSGPGPVGLPPVPWTEKAIERSPFSVRHVGHCCRGDLVGRTTFWIFFEWLAKVRATG